MSRGLGDVYKRQVLSGIIDTRLDEVIQCYESAGYQIVERMAIDDWRALKLKRA